MTYLPKMAAAELGSDLAGYIADCFISTKIAG